MEEIRLQCTLSRKNFLKVMLVLVLLFVIHIVVMNHVTTLSEVNIRPAPARQSDPRVPKAHRKTILLWTPFNGPNTELVQKSCIKQCSVECDITTDKEDIKNVDVVSFHLTDLWTDSWNIGTKETIKFPSYRRSDQIWTLTNLEPPPNLYGDLRVFNGLFNWTVWYRKDSDIYFPYGRPVELTNEERDAAAEGFARRNIFKEKTNGITGKISNCKDVARRYRLVEDLRKYLDIDMFGKCYNKACGDPEVHDSCDNITQTYKFYLALENSRCKDYVTEKYWWALHRDQIPIVNWDHTHVNKHVVVPNSYISIYDFPDLKSLGEYINSVSNNETLYNSYFEWKMNYKVVHTCMSCAICEAAHEKRENHVIEDLDAWVRNDTCNKVGVRKLCLLIRSLKFM